MQSHLQFGSFVFDAIAGVAMASFSANMRQTIQKFFRSKQVSRYRGPYAIYSVVISTPWEVRAPEQECLQPQDCTNSQAFLELLVVGLTVATKSARNSGPPGHLADSP